MEKFKIMKATKTILTLIAILFLQFGYGQGNTTNVEFNDFKTHSLTAYKIAIKDSSNIKDIIISPNITELIVSYDSISTVYDIKTKEKLFSFKHDYYNYLEWINDNEIIYGEFGKIVLINGNNGNIIKQWETDIGDAKDLLSPDKSKIIIISTDLKTVKTKGEIIDLKTLTVLYSFNIKGDLSYLENIKWTKDGKKIYTNKDDIACVWDAENGKIIEDFKSDSQLKFSNNQKYCIYTDYRTFRIINTVNE